MTDSLTRLAAAIPLDPSDRGSVPVMADDLRAVLAIRSALSHHLDPGTDPCQDRGVEWPCDVADALEDGS